jgi:hypothetical protein
MPAVALPTSAVPSGSHRGTRPGAAGCARSLDQPWVKNRIGFASTSSRSRCWARWYADQDRAVEPWFGCAAPGSRKSSRAAGIAAGAVVIADLRPVPVTEEVRRGDGPAGTPPAVALGGREYRSACWPGRMTQQLLGRAQVGATLQQMGRRRVALIRGARCAASPAARAATATMRRTAVACSRPPRAPSNAASCRAGQRRPAVRSHRSRRAAPAVRRRTVRSFARRRAGPRRSWSTSAASGRTARSPGRRWREELNAARSRRAVGEVRRRAPRPVRRPARRITEGEGTAGLRAGELRAHIDGRPVGGPTSKTSRRGCPAGERRARRAGTAQPGEPAAQRRDRQVSGLDASMRTAWSSSETTSATYARTVCAERFRTAPSTARTRRPPPASARTARRGGGGTGIAPALSQDDIGVAALGSGFDR